AARSRGPQRIFEGLLATERFDRDIRAAAIREPLDFSDHIAGVRIERDVRAKTSRGCEALLVGIDPDDERGAAHACAERCAEADRPLGEDRDAVADANVAALGAR